MKESRSYLFAVRRADGVVTVLCEAYPDADVQRHGVLVLREIFDDGDRFVDAFIRAGNGKRVVDDGVRKR